MVKGESSLLQKIKYGSNMEDLTPYKLCREMDGRICILREDYDALLKELHYLKGKVEMLEIASGLRTNRIDPIFRSNKNAPK